MPTLEIHYVEPVREDFDFGHPVHDEAMYLIASYEKLLATKLVEVMSNYTDRLANGVDLQTVALKLREDVLNVGRVVGVLSHRLIDATDCLSCGSMCDGGEACPLA